MWQGHLFNGYFLSKTCKTATLPVKLLHLNYDSQTYIEIICMLKTAYLCKGHVMFLPKFVHLPISTADYMLKDCIIIIYTISHGRNFHTFSKIVHLGTPKHQLDLNPLYLASLGAVLVLYWGALISSTHSS